MSLTALLYIDSFYISDGIELFQEERKRVTESPHYTRLCHREIEESD